MNQIISLGWVEISGPRPLPSTLFSLLLPLDASSFEQMKKWRLIIQEAKAHPEL
jgi:hypothetical protein